MAMMHGGLLIWGQSQFEVLERCLDHLLEKGASRVRMKLDKVQETSREGEKDLSLASVEICRQIFTVYVEVEVFSMIFGEQERKAW